MLQCGQPLLHGRERRKGSVRLRLIPIGDRVVVIGAMIGVAVFDGRLEGCLEDHWRIQMKAVHARSGSRPSLLYDGRTVQLVRERMVLEAPGSQEIILCPGAGDGWLL